MANNSVKSNRKTMLATTYIVRVAFMSALLTALKFALSFVPNVEVVTLLILVYGACFSLAYALPATLIFCAVEVAIYGVGSWVLLYFVYWPLLALFASLFLKGGRLPLALIFAVLGSELFGVLSACCDTLFCVSYFVGDQGAKYWVAYYLRGVVFDIIHMVSNFVVVLVLYKPLTLVCKKFAPQNYYRQKTSSKLISAPYVYIRELNNHTTNHEFEDDIH